MSRARNIANLVDANGDIVAEALDNANDASALTTGTLNAARLPTTGVDASSLTTGSIPAARIASNTISDAMIADGAGQYHPFIGFNQYCTSHNANGTISWSSIPGQSSNPPSGAAFVKRNGSSTYTLSSNTFTCKSAGVYFIYATVIPYTSTGSMYLYIRKNGTNCTDNRSSGSEQTHENISTFTICDLAVNDTIHIHAGNNVHAGIYGNFTIFKLGEA